MFKKIYFNYYKNQKEGKIIILKYIWFIDSNYIFSYNLIFILK